MGRRKARGGAWKPGHSTSWTVGLPPRERGTDCFISKLPSGFSLQLFCDSKPAQAMALGEGSTGRWHPCGEEGEHREWGGRFRAGTQAQAQGWLQVHFHLKPGKEQL